MAHQSSTPSTTFIATAASQPAGGSGGTGRASALGAKSKSRRPKLGGNGSTKAAPPANGGFSTTQPTGARQISPQWPFF